MFYLCESVATATTKRLGRNIIVMNSLLYVYFEDLSEQNFILSEQF
ncbi:hypothetical protein [Lysinibacillus sp. CTST325]